MFCWEILKMFKILILATPLENCVEKCQAETWRVIVNLDYLTKPNGLTNVPQKNCALLNSVQKIIDKEAWLRLAF